MGGALAVLYGNYYNYIYSPMPHNPFDVGDSIFKP